MSITVTPSQLPQILKDVVSAGLVPMIHGQPGTAKSAIINQFAEANRLHPIDLRLSMMDPTDLSGFPIRDGDRMTFVPLDVLPLLDDPLPKKNGVELDGFCLFLDEFNSAPLSVQAAAYKLVYDKKAGNNTLHKRCVIICAGNLQGDRAIVNQLSTAMQSRLVHITLEMNHIDWLKWAGSNGIDHRVMSYIEKRPDMLHKFDPKHNDLTFACARTWHFLSNYIKTKMKFTGVDTAVMGGIVSNGVAVDFKVFCELYNQLPKIEQMVASPTTVKLSTEPSHQYALCMLISHNMDDTNVTELMIVTNRLNVDYQVVLLRDVFAKGKVDKNNPAIDAWITSNHDVIF